MVMTMSKIMMMRRMLTMTTVMLMMITPEKLSLQSKSRSPSSTRASRHSCLIFKALPSINHLITPHFQKR